MSLLVIATLWGAAALLPNGADTSGLALANRLMTAIKGQSEFQDSDFKKPLVALDKIALRKFAKCQVQRVDFAGRPHPQHPNVFVQDRNLVVVDLRCKGISQRKSPGFLLHVQDHKIVTVEMFDADAGRSY